MFKKICLIIVIILLLIFVAYSAEIDDFIDLSQKDILRMKISEYLHYIKTNPPLDRLYRQGDTCFFLRNDQKLFLLKMQSLCSSQQYPSELNSTTTQPFSEGDINGFYHNYRETEEMLQDLAARYPDLTELFSIGQSIEGRELYVIKISDHAAIEEYDEEPNIYIVGCHHAREWISVEVPLLFIQYLLENYATNPYVKRAVDGAQIYIQPIQNPDGLEFSIHTYRFWRKNRRYNGNLSWGVDPNRNYGYQWGYDDIGSSSDPDSGIYRGSSPFSEPECAAVRDFLLAHPPSGSLSFHNYSQAIIYPWGYKRQPTVDNEEMAQIAEEMSNRIFQVNGRLYTFGLDPLGYPTNGGTNDWIYGTFRTPSFTIELPPQYAVFGGFFTSEEMIDSAFSENLPAMLYFVNYFIQDI